MSLSDWSSGHVPVRLELRTCPCQIGAPDVSLLDGSSGRVPVRLELWICSCHIGALDLCLADGIFLDILLTDLAPAPMSFVRFVPKIVDIEPKKMQIM
jgi:hypothetical protein